MVDPFRPPTSPYGPGNRGIDYATAVGTAVRAASDGEVVFAGNVGGSLHVVVLHGDGLRSSYSFLRTAEVRRGEQVLAGQPVGTSGERFHFGVRVGEEYVDPLALLAGARPVRVRLVADPVGPAPEPEERRVLARSLSGLATTTTAVGQGALSWARDGGVAVARPLAPVGDVRAWLHYARALAVPMQLRLMAAAAAAAAERSECTPADRAAHPTDGTPRRAGQHQRRLAVLVAGLGSSSGDAAVLDVDTRSLGYEPADVVQFSYRGGTVAERPYDPTDTTVDLHLSGQRLADLLGRLAHEHPGVPVDVIAHSQGGLVARVALLGAPGRTPPPAATLVTLGTPHGGTNPATALGLVTTSTPGDRMAEAGRLLGTIDLRGPSVRQMAETSEFVGWLGKQPPLTGTRVVSVAARDDVIVPSPRSQLPGASNVVVDVPGIDDHGGLPGSAAAHRELALALAGLPPSCQPVVDRVVDAVTGELVSSIEDHLGAGLSVAAHGARGPVGPPVPGARR